MLHNLFLLDLSVFNELLLKNDPVKKTISFSVFVEGFRMPHDQVFGTRRQNPSLQSS